MSGYDPRMTVSPLSDPSCLQHQVRNYSPAWHGGSCVPPPPHCANTCSSVHGGRLTPPPPSYEYSHQHLPPPLPRRNVSEPPPRQVAPIPASWEYTSYKTSHTPANGGAFEAGGFQYNNGSSFYAGRSIGGGWMNGAGGAMGIVNKSETHTTTYTGISSNSYGILSPLQYGGMLTPPQPQQYYGGGMGPANPPQGQEQGQRPVRGRFSNLLKKPFFGKPN